MTKNMTEKVTIAYESPNCDIVDIKAEGVLCSSFEKANIYLDDEGKEELYQW